MIITASKAFIFLECLLVSVQGASIFHINDSDNSDRAINEVTDVRPLIDVNDYLEKYGYLKPLSKSPGSDDGTIQHSEEERSYAIRRFQRFAGLEETGVMNADTSSKMAEPRCGFPDVDLDSEDGISPLAYSAPGIKWPDNRVSWRVSSYSKALPETIQWEAFDRAFAVWSNVSDLRVTYTEGEADVEILFAVQDHQDGANNRFDGPGGVLAHAFLPPDGRVHFDEDENWQYRSDQGVELKTVAAHEFGHALGLRHSRVRGALMAPFYRDYDPNFELPEDDVKGIQSLYGTQVSTPRPTTAMVQVMEKSDCKLLFDAITNGPDGYIYMFSGSMVYKLEEYCYEGISCIVAGFPKPIREVYEKAPKTIGAAAYVPDERKRTYFFKGRKIWRYTRFTLDKGYPKLMDVEDTPEKPYAAYVHKNQFADYQLYIFGIRHFWEMNLYTEKLTNTKMRMKTYWDKFPYRPSAITQTRDGSIYVFKGKYYKKYDHLRSIQQKKALKAPAWFGGVCGYSIK